MSDSTDAVASTETQKREREPSEEHSSKRQRAEEVPAGAVDTAAAPSEYSLASRIAQLENGSASSESLVGITSYVNPDLPAFEHAIIKHRFTDFLVWEIARGGRVVKLKDISRPDGKAAITSSTGENATSAKDAADKQTEEAVPELKDFISEEKLGELQAFFEKGRTPETESTSVLTDPIESKDQRKAFHGAIRHHFEGKLASEAQDAGVIKITWNTGQGKERRTLRPSKEDQRNLPPYVQFTLHKTNRETQDCIGQLASRLGVYPKDLATAGTKDKRGVTTQLVTLKRGKRTIEEVWDAVNGLRHGKSRDGFRGGKRGRGNAHRAGGGSLGRDGITPMERGERGIRIGDMEYVQEPLDLGMLEGNRFGIVLRDVKVPSEDVIDKAIRTLQETGFINFYGMQRFGNSTVPTHQIGLAILQGNWKEATRLILSEKSGDSDEVVAARRAWTVEGDAAKAMRNLPKWAVAERSMLEFYKSQGNDSNHNGALAKIPKNLRMMYVHAYQSYIWNSAVSERIRLYGCESAVVGDLVYESPEDTATAKADTDAANVLASGPTPLTGGKVTQQTLMASSKLPKVKVLTEEEVSKYTIYDVVLPLPGYMVTYPTGTIGELYKKMMLADGLDIERMFRSQKEYSLGGQYRKILKRPNHLTWEKIRYTDPNADIIQPDEDVLLGMAAPKLEETGEKLAIRLEFDLDSASYATMALREVLKSETSNVNQRALTEAMLAKERPEADPSSNGSNTNAVEIQSNGGMAE